MREQIVSSVRHEVAADPASHHGNHRAFGTLLSVVFRDRVKRPDLRPAIQGSRTRFRAPLSGRYLLAADLDQVAILFDLKDPCHA